MEVVLSCGLGRGEFYKRNTKSPLQELENGKLHFTLKGKRKLPMASWHLVLIARWKTMAADQRRRRCQARLKEKMDDTSALSGKTMAQLSRNGAVWESKTLKPADSLRKRIQAKIPTSKILADEIYRADEGADWRNPLTE